MVGHSQNILILNICWGVSASCS